MMKHLSVTLPCPGNNGTCEAPIRVTISPARPAIQVRGGGWDPPEPAEIDQIEGCATHADALWEDDKFWEAVQAALASEEAAAWDREVEQRIARDEEGTSQ